MSLVSRNLSMVMVAVWLCAGMGCKQEGPAEQAGKKVDQAVGQAG